MNTHLRKDLTGLRFGRLVALSYISNGKNSKWLCACDCGNKKEVLTGALGSGNTKSCGCLSRETASKNNATHGHTKNGRPTKAYQSWLNMKRRCLDPKNKRFEAYGGRGIKICDRWLAGFENFLADMGEPPAGFSIDRVDNNGNYTPENCRWACRSDQMKNRRNSVLISYAGKTQNLSEWADETGIKADTIAARLNLYKWSVEAALTIRPRRGKGGGGRGHTHKNL
jgi:hypothetical protein